MCSVVIAGIRQLHDTMNRNSNTSITSDTRPGDGYGLWVKDGMLEAPQSLFFFNSGTPYSLVTDQQHPHHGLLLSMLNDAKTEADLSSWDVMAGEHTQVRHL